MRRDATTPHTTGCAKWWWRSWVASGTPSSTAGWTVESTTGAVAVGREGSCCPTAFALPVPYQFGPLLRFLSPLIEPDVRNYRIRLSPIPSDLRPRQVAESHRDVVQAECSVEILVRDLGNPGASLPSTGAPTSDGPAARCICGRACRCREPRLGRSKHTSRVSGC